MNVKKLMLVAALSFGGVFGSVTYAGDLTPVSLQIVDENVTGSGNTRGPQRVLVLTQEDNTFTMQASDVDYTLLLLDDGGSVAYTVFVPAGTTQIVLPATLEGCYELRLVASNYYFYGIINL